MKKDLNVINPSYYYENPLFPRFVYKEDIIKFLEAWLTKIIGEARNLEEEEKKALIPMLKQLITDLEAYSDSLSREKVFFESLNRRPSVFFRLAQRMVSPEGKMLISVLSVLLVPVIITLGVGGLAVLAFIGGPAALIGALGIIGIIGLALVVVGGVFLLNIINPDRVAEEKIDKLTYWVVASEKIEKLRHWVVEDPLFKQGGLTKRKSCVDFLCHLLKVQYKEFLGMKEEGDEIVDSSQLPRRHSEYGECRPFFQGLPLALPDENRVVLASP
jgi:hypothetical protein